MKMIINANDFGYSTYVNKAIEKALKTGLISSTTIRVNMPGFAKAVALAKTENLIGYRDNMIITCNICSN